MGNRASYSAKTSVERLNQFTDRWARLILVLSILLVLVATLIPFNFSVYSRPLEETLRGFIKFSTDPYDFAANILLFVPLGVGFASYFRRQQSRFDCFKLAVAMSCGASLTVEILQVFLPNRDPSLVDIFSNSLGGAFGAWMFQRWRVKLLDRFLSFIQAIRRHLSLKRLLVALAIYTALVLVSSATLQNSGYLVNWDPNFPLLVGNEQAGGRPWRGSVSDLYIADRALAASEVAELLSGQQPPEVLGNFLLAAYELTGSGNYKDQTGHLPNLVWQGTPPLLESKSPALLSSEHWLATEASVTPLTQKLRQTSQFTIITTIATDDLNQTGPSRVISVSASPSRRNFTLGQQNSHLIFRLRTPLTGDNGTLPQMVFPNIFTDTNPHRLILTYKDSVLKLYIDNLQQAFTQRWTPERALFSLLIPTDVTNIEIDSLIQIILKFVYYSFLFVPLGILLGITALMLDQRLVSQSFLVYGSIFLFAFLLEANRVVATDTGLEPVNLLFSIAIAISTMLFVSNCFIPWCKAFQASELN